MNFFYIILIFILLNNCSFDTRSGIWSEGNDFKKNTKNTFDVFKTLSSSENTFDKVIEKNKDVNFDLPSQVFNKNWSDIYFSKSNNLQNFMYDNLNKQVYKGKKISRNNIENLILKKKDNIITTDLKGNLIIFSLEENKVKTIFNFYQKKYKNINKILNIIADGEIIYVSDNLGYLYSYNYQTQQILWAQNYKIPFRSNLKIFDNKLVAANQNNNLYFLNKNNGDLLRMIPTEETIIKNEFINNLSLNNELTFFLNTYGSLYAINNNNLKIKWFLNLNRSLNINPSDLFQGNQIVNLKDKIAVSTNNFLYVINSNNGSVILKKKFSTKIKPIILNNYLFCITKNNFLISLDLISGEIIYSYNIEQKIASFLDSKKKNIQIKSFLIADNHLIVFLENSYVLTFDINGNLKKINKLPSKLKTEPIIANKLLIFLDSKNKVSIVN